MEDIKNHFAALGALEASLSADKQVPMGSYITASVIIFLLLLSLEFKAHKLT